MKKKILIVLSGLVLIVIALVRCNSDNSKPDGNGKDAVGTVSITPVALPTNIVPGFHFPEDSNLIYHWTNDSSFANRYDSASIYKHAWGIWAGLTAPSGQKYAGDDLLVYETWLGTTEIQRMISEDSTQGGCEGSTFIRNGRALLSRPKQLEHAARFAAQKAGVSFASMRMKVISQQSNDTIPWVTVSYSPDASCFATRNSIYKQSVINKYYNPEGLGAIPVFPQKSITIKPTYLVYSDTGKLFKFPVWITAPAIPDSNFYTSANSFIYIDRDNKQPAGKVAMPVDSSEQNANKIAAATINLNDFIYIKVDQQMANEMNNKDSIQGLNGAGRAVAGQIALLVAMHVTSKEVANWTWQSYYWTPNRTHPGAPSSDLAASVRPSQIKGAAANYACVAAYVMLTPDNAVNSKANGPMFGYNPYLEGGFGPGTFLFANTYNTSYKYGMQSNCMSCHALAIPDPSGQYTTDQTIDLKSAYFKNKVSLDFAWSIQSSVISDTLPYWQWTSKK